VVALIGLFGSAVGLVETQAQWFTALVCATSTAEYFLCTQLNYNQNSSSPAFSTSQLAYRTLTLHHHMAHI